MLHGHHHCLLLLFLRLHSAWLTNVVYQLHHQADWMLAVLGRTIQAALPHVALTLLFTSAVLQGITIACC